MKQIQSHLKRAPALFIGHGNPMNAIQNNLYADTLKNIGETVQKPDAILMISAHWTTPYSAVSSHSETLMYDMYGFPDALYKVSYKVKNADFLLPQLQAIIPSLKVEKRDLDHGVWSVLVHMYPDADIPVVQLSINTTLSMQEYFDLGCSLAVLRDSGMMIMGSGNITHNLSRAVLSQKDAPIDLWAQEFDLFVKDALDKRDFAALINIQTAQRYARLAHPSLEHYLPLLYIAGALQEDDKSEFIYEGFEHANLSMRSWMVY